MSPLAAVAMFVGLIVALLGGLGLLAAYLMTGSFDPDGGVNTRLLLVVAIAGAAVFAFGYAAA